MLLRRLAVSLFLLGALGAAFAQDLPERPIRFLVGFVPGGAVGEALEELNRRSRQDKQEWNRR